MSFLASCASPDWRDSYSVCPDSGQAYFSGIPLASRDEHAQAESFTPLDPSNCMIYVVRSDRTGSKSAQAKVFLYQRGMGPPALPPDDGNWLDTDPLLDPQWSERHLKETPQELHKAEIFGPDVYAMWELAPGSYILDASLSMSHPFARAVIACTAGRPYFWAVSATSFLSSKAKLNELDESEGKALVLHRLRSAGVQPGGPNSKGWVGQEECSTER
jgi:hypothetical protein